MVLVPMKVILDAAERGRYGVGAFNINNMEQAQGIMNAALETDSPLIYQVSRGALDYSDKVVLYDIIMSLVEKYPEIPVTVHLDHGNSPQTCFDAIKLGFTSVMMDGSLLADGKTPSDYDYNRDVTKKVVDYAHKFGVTVEAEIGCLGGIEEGHGSGEEHVTKSEDVRRLYDDCRMDTCAIAWGTKHGAFKGEKGKPPILRHDIVERTHLLVPEVHLVSHGSSSVPEKLRDSLNSYGVIKKYRDSDGHRHISAYGEDFDLNIDDPRQLLDFLFDKERMPLSVGVPMSDLEQAIREGMRKINVDTDGRMAVTGAILRTLHTQFHEFDPRKYLGPARTAIKDDFAVDAMIAFGSAGHAEDIEYIPLEQMADIYIQNH